MTPKPGRRDHSVVAYCTQQCTSGHRRGGNAECRAAMAVALGGPVTWSTPAINTASVDAAVGGPQGVCGGSALACGAARRKRNILASIAGTSAASALAAAMPCQPKVSTLLSVMVPNSAEISTRNACHSLLPLGIKPVWGFCSPASCGLSLEAIKVGRTASSALRLDAALNQCRSTAFGIDVFSLRDNPPVMVG